MNKALRTISMFLSIALDIRQVAPRSLSANFNKTAGLVTKALMRYAPELTVVGGCHEDFTTKMKILQALEQATGQPIAESRAQLNTLGFNYLPSIAALR